MKTGEMRRRGALLRGLVVTLAMAGPLGLATARPASALELGDGHEVAARGALDNRVLDLIEIGDDGLEVEVGDLAEVELGDDGLEVELLDHIEVELGD